MLLRLFKKLELNLVFVFHLSVSSLILDQCLCVVVDFKNTSYSIGFFTNYAKYLSEIKKQTKGTVLKDSQKLG